MLRKSFEIYQGLLIYFDSYPKRIVYNLTNDWVVTYG